MKKTSMLIWLLPMFLNAQEENPLDIFKALENQIWFAEGTWGDNSSFKQEVSFEFSLNNTIVQVSSKGFTNKEQSEFGKRNFGIRQYDSNSETIRFWEFDIFGGITKGTVEADGKNLIYQYEYGGTLITEMWIYKNDSVYDFIVGLYENGKWIQKFLETQFKGRRK